MVRIPCVISFLESDESESTVSSLKLVQNEWDDVDVLGESMGTSKEIQETNIIDDYELAMKAWSENRLDDAFRCFFELSQKPMLLELQVETFQNFDWEKARKEFSPRSIPKIKQYFFAIHKSLAKFVKEPTTHYLQVRNII